MGQPTAILNNREFKKRILSALIMAPVAVLAIWLGGEVFLIFLAVLAPFMAREWARISDSSSRIAWIISAVFLLAVVIGAGMLFPPVILGSLLLLGAVIIFLCAGNSGLHGRFLMSCGVVYMGTALVSAVWLRSLAAGDWLFFWLISMVIATDIGAYISGRSIGGPKLAPSLSPNKTWAGLIGGLSAAALASVIVSSFFADQASLALLIGALIALLAQAGDLFESWMKRQAGVKDSSRLIPGHGGLLDRLDGFLAATPVFAFYIYSSSSFL